MVFWNPEPFLIILVPFRPICHNLTQMVQKGIFKNRKEIFFITKPFHKNGKFVTELKELIFLNNCSPGNVTEGERVFFWKVWQLLWKCDSLETVKTVTGKRFLTRVSTLKLWQFERRSLFYYNCVTVWEMVPFLKALVNTFHMFEKCCPQNFDKSKGIKVLKLFVLMSQSIWF